MKKEMKHAQVNTLEKVALGHCYLLCINFMKGSLELIDNRFLDNKISFVHKYKNHPRNLLRAFATFYATYHSTKNKDMFEEICNFKTKTLKMKWMSNDNYDDCGIYLLKHKETYHGEKDIEWENELQLNNVDQMKKLRVEYCGKIMSHKENKEHHSMQIKARKWEKE
ncbi:cAMP-dependent protein kinase catalytic subunit alpha [Bienertia sinuspersici]